jgi:hypothetical protein
MKPSLKRALGILFIVLSLLMFLIAVCQITPIVLVDIPCLGSDDSDYPPGTTQDTRIGYCISYYPVKAISGGEIYASGSTKQDEVTVDQLVFRREDETLYVNGHPINSGEVYKTTDWRLSANPWLIITTRFEIRNDGITPIDSLASVNMLFVSGDAVEGWLPNPLGIIVLGGGIWLFVRGTRERSLVSNNLAAAG